MKTIAKTAENLNVGNVLIIKNQPIKVVGIWGLTVSLDMYVTSEVKATSYTANRKLTLKASQEFNVLDGEESKKSLFEITHLLRQK
jgi:hypothetical protein